MSAQLKPYEKPIRVIANELVNAKKRSKARLADLQELIVALTLCTRLMKEWFVEVEGLFVMVALLGFFIIGVVSLFVRLHA